MSLNDIVSLAGIITRGLVGVYFSIKYKQIEKQSKNV